MDENEAAVLGTVMTPTHLSMKSRRSDCTRRARFTASRLELWLTDSCAVPVFLLYLHRVPSSACRNCTSGEN